MAPKRKTAAPAKMPPVALSTRRTRSVTAAERAAAAAGAQAQTKGVEVDPPASPPPSPPPPPPAKKAKNEDAEDLVEVEEAPSRSRKGKEVVSDEEEEEGGPMPADEGYFRERIVVIEACKQCNSFKTRALQVKDALENLGITVSINPEKPRRGCFEIRENGQIFISLLNMPRPFTLMKQLDMNQVISYVLKKVRE